MKLKILCLIGIGWFVACEDKSVKTEKFSGLNTQDSFPAEVMNTLKDRGYLGYFLGDVKPQKMKWSGNRDTILVGKEGVRVHFYQDALVHQDGRPITGEVDIELKEYVKPGDMILAGMSTTMEDGRMLRTGGMVYLSAYSEGKELKVSDEKPIKIDFPIQGEEVKGMRLFTGNRNEKGSVQWSFAQKRPKRLQAIPDSGTYRVFDYLPRCIECLKEIQQNLSNEHEAYFPQAPGNYTLSLDIEPGGRISYVGFPDSFPVDLVEGVLNSLERVVPFFPARESGKEHRYTASLNLRFFVNKNKMKLKVSSSEIEEYTWPLLKEMIQQGIYTCYRKTKPYKGENSVWQTSDKLNYIPDFSYFLPMSERIHEIRKDSIILNDMDPKELERKNKYYSQFSFNLRLLNCDAFNRYPPSALKSFDLKDLPDNCVGVIFYPNTQSILNGTPANSNSLTFGQIPYAHPFQLICFGPLNQNAHKEETDWYYSVSKINQNNWTNPNLDFKVVSYPKLAESIRNLR